jgi:23S rRNA pseudouridine2605 synthase
MADAGIASRRASEELIEAKKVKVNGRVAQIGLRVDPRQDKVSYNGQVIGGRVTHVYFLTNKPAGIVSTTQDDHSRRTVLSLLPDHITSQYRLFPVGRLDLDSEGLLLLTNDGDLTNRLTHPKFEVDKMYLVLVDRMPSFKALDHLMRGVKLSEGRTKRANVEIVEDWSSELGISEDDFYQALSNPNNPELEAQENPVWLTITIHEGRYHQVKRMLERVGYDTLRLIRIKLGPFALVDLKGKRWMQVDGAQIKHLFQAGLVGRNR